MWVACGIFAYFAAAPWPALHHNKLAPSISPGKSREGVWGVVWHGVVLALALGCGRRPLADRRQPYTRLYSAGWWFLLIAVVFMAAMSVVGDLVGIADQAQRSREKDSSGLLPAMAALDRVDALLPHAATGHDAHPTYFPEA